MASSTNFGGPKSDRMLIAGRDRTDSLGSGDVTQDYTKQLRCGGCYEIQEAN
jgi:hypothetical protein